MDIALAKSAFLDLNHLLVEGFDCNWKNCKIDGVKDTIKELKKFILKHDPTWEFPQ